MQKKKVPKICDEISKQKDEQKNKINIFLSEIHSIIENIRKKKGKKYSLLSSIFNCFYENKSLLLSKEFIYNYLLQEINNYRGKMISSFLECGMKDINKDNYIRYAYKILTRNKCMVLEKNNKFSIDINFIYSHQNLMEKMLFDKDEKIFNSNNSKLNIIGNNIVKNNILKEEGEEKIIDDDDDYTIEIIESDQDEIDDIDINKGVTLKSTIFNSELNVINLKEGHLLGSEQLKIDNIINFPKQSEIIYINKKRNKEEVKEIDECKKEKINNFKENADKENVNEKKYEPILIDEEKDNTIEKGDINKENEILSLIESGNKLISLFQNKELLKNTGGEKNNNKSFNEIILINYQNDNNLKEYINMLNDDYSTFQNTIKSLIDCKSSLNEFNSNKYMGKISVINKIISEKEKCNLLIEKIANKLKQIFLEYDYIIKIINFFDINKGVFFCQLNEIMKFYHEKEAVIYVNNIKTKMKEELRIAFDITKEENETLCRI